MRTSILSLIALAAPIVAQARGNLVEVAKGGLRVTKVSLDNIQPLRSGGAEVTVFSYPRYGDEKPVAVTVYHFSCTGMFRVLYAQDDIPVIRGSAASEIQSLACPIARQKARMVRQEQAKIDQTLEYRAMHPSPRDYCVGFGPAECAVIQRGVDATVKPPYCVGNYWDTRPALAPIEKRVCDARAPANR